MPKKQSTDYDDAFTAAAGEDDLIDNPPAGAGEDTVAGGEGADTAEGGEGGEGADTAEGGEGEGAVEGADTAEGGEGDDTAEGGEGEDTAEGGEGAGKPAAAAAPAEANDDLLQRLANLLKTDPAQPQEQPQPQTQGQPQGQGQGEEAPSVYTPEEEQLISAYEADWPEIARAEQLKRRAEYRAVVGHVFSEVRKVLGPLSETVDTLATRTHLTELQSTVSDYEDVREKVVAWVEQQPAYLRAAYEHVITQGTVEEVADLVERYRRETGTPAKADPAPTPQAQQQQTRDTELPAVAKKAAAGLAPVRSKRSTVSAQPDPQDFDAAFAAFAAKI